MVADFGRVFVISFSFDVFTQTEQELVLSRPGSRHCLYSLTVSSVLRPRCPVFTSRKAKIGCFTVRFMWDDNMMELLGET